MYLFDIRIKSGPSIDYYVYSNGQLKRNNGKVVNSIQDIKGDLIEMWKDAKKIGLLELLDIVIVSLIQWNLHQKKSRK